VRMRGACLALGLLIISGPAPGANLPTAAPPPYFNWAGCYVGGHVGGGWGSSGFNSALLESLIATNILGQNTNAISPNPLPQNGAAGAAAAATVPQPIEGVGGGAHTAGFVGGGQTGCDYQLTHLLIGVEADVSGATLGGSSGPVFATDAPPNGNVSAKTDLITEITGRVGYAAGPWLVFAKGGGAWSHNSYSLTTSDGTPWTWRGTRSGWTVGGGIEWAFWQNWSAKLEYHYYDFGGSGTLANPAGMITFGNYTQYVQAIELGLNWHFWTGATPRY
jgi:outer membrane immunogenic protein